MQHITFRHTVALNSLRSSVASIYTTALRLFMHQPYPYVCSGLTHLYTAVLITQRPYTYAHNMQQHYTHQRRSVAHIYTAAALYTHQRRSVAHIYTAVTLQTPTPQRSTYIHSNIITQPQYTQVHSHFTLIPTSALHVYM